MPSIGMRIQRAPALAATPGPGTTLTAEDDAAVGGKHLAGNPAAVRPEQPGDQRGHLLRRPLPANQRLRRALAPGFAGEPAGPELGIGNEPRCDHVGGTPVRAKLPGEVVDKSVQRGL